MDSRAPLPAWATARPGEFLSVTRTADELSVIVAQSRPPRDIKCERTWRLLKVQGPLPLNLIGIIAGLSGTLADAGVSIFAFSTYDTDYLLVKQVDLDRAVQALRRAGYSVDEAQADFSAHRGTATLFYLSGGALRCSAHVRIAFESAHRQAQC
jgi:hypothetical protein